MNDTIEEKCISKGIKLTDQRKVIARVMSESKETYGESDHPDVDELYNRVSKIDPKISIATVYRTVKIFEEAGILTKHDFKGGKARYEEIRESHHDHLIDVKTGHIIEFSDTEINKLQNIIDKAYNSGVIYIDTAQAYGKSEEVKRDMVAVDTMKKAGVPTIPGSKALSHID